MKNQLADGNEDVEVTQTIDDELENSWNEDSLEKNQSKDIIQSTEEKVESVDKVQVVEELVDKSATGDTTQQFLDIPVVITQEYVTDFTSLADAIKKSNIEITIKNDNIYIRIWNGLTFSNSLTKGNELDKELIYKNYRTINFILNISSKLIELINETPYL